MAMPSADSFTPSPVMDVQLCTCSSPFFPAIMQLRFEAYTADGRLTWQKTVRDMRDRWDERSVSVLIRVNGARAGSIRVTTSVEGEELSYPDPLTDGDYARLFGSTDMSRCLPERKDYAESSRLCIAPSMRGKGLWYPLAAQMVILGLYSRRPFIVGSAIDELLPTWEKIGFERTGLRYLNEDISGRIHEMIVLDVARVIEGNCDHRFRPWVTAALESPPQFENDITKLLRR
jgi:hypothetical protein